MIDELTLFELILLSVVVGSLIVVGVTNSRLSVLFADIALISILVLLISMVIRWSTFQLSVVSITLLVLGIHFRNVMASLIKEIEYLEGNNRNIE